MIGSKKVFFRAPKSITLPNGRVIVTSATVALYGGTPHVAPQATPQVKGILEHSGGLNGCGCHFNRVDRRVSLPSREWVWVCL